MVRTLIRLNSNYRTTSRLLLFFLVILSMLRAHPVSAVHQEDQERAKPIVSADGRKYEVLDQTLNHRYAVVWGIRGQQVNFARYHSDEKYSSHIIESIDRGALVINGIVDCQRHHLITTIAGCDYFPPGGKTDLSVKWASNGRYVFICYGGWWTPNGFFVVTIAGPHAGYQESFYPSFSRSLQRNLELSTGRTQPMRDAVIVRFKLDHQDHLSITTHNYRSKAEVGWSYDICLVYSLTRDGLFSSYEPRPSHMAVATYLDDPDNSGNADDEFKQQHLILAAFRPNGSLAWRDDLYPAIRRDILNHISHHLPRKFLSRTKPDVTVESGDGDFSPLLNLPYSPHTPLRFTVTVYPVPGDSRWLYQATATCRIRLAGHVPMITLTKFSDEETEQDGQQTKRLGVPDTPIKLSSASR